MHNAPMELHLIDDDRIKAVEARSSERFPSSTAAVDCVIEACFSDHAEAAILYAENLPDEFFDLSSGQAGAVLQKLRNYRVRLAVVCPPGGARWSSRFGEMAAEECKKGDFGLFESRTAAWDWLSQMD